MSEITLRFAVAISDSHLSLFANWPNSVYTVENFHTNETPGVPMISDNYNSQKSDFLAKDLWG